MFLHCARNYSSVVRSRSGNVQQYLNRQLNEEYAKLAREHSFRARSAFKLIELHQRFKIFKQGQNVLDIGAAPGSWCQVAHMYVKPDGYILGVDLQPIQALKDVDLLPKADIRDPLVQQGIIKRLDGRTVDCVLSDMAPNPTGSKDIDHQRIVALCRTVLDFVSYNVDPSQQLKLSDTASFVCKIWDGCARNELAKEISNVFGKVRFFKPDSSRDNSAELFLYSKRIKNA